MKLHGPIAFVEIYGSNGAMSIRRRVRLTFGDPLRLGRWEKAENGSGPLPHDEAK